MNNFVIDTPDNFWQIRWLDKYMEGHKGFIAGGCFKNILSGERVKDIDIFFAREKPDKGKLLIVEDIDGAYDLVYLTKSKPWEELSEKDHYMRWAYIEDLLPCEEERG